VAGTVLEGIRHQQDEATLLKETMTGLSPVRRLPAANMKKRFEEFFFMKEHDFFLRLWSNYY